MVALDLYHARVALKAGTDQVCFAQGDGDSSLSQRAGEGSDRRLVEQAAKHEGAAAIASIAQAALSALPCGGVSEGTRLMALCRKCIEVRKFSAQGASTSV